MDQIYYNVTISVWQNTKNIILSQIINKEYKY